MVVVYPFSPKDAELALQNAKWMVELGGCKGHEVLMIADKRCPEGLVHDVGFELTRAFDKMHFMPAAAAIDGWPQGANYFFRIAAGWLQDKQWKHYLWLEPDAMPMTENWVDKLGQEYVHRPVVFGGAMVIGARYGRAPPLHACSKPMPTGEIASARVLRCDPSSDNLKRSTWPVL